MVDEEQQENVERQQPEATWVPDTYVIIFFVVLLAAVATYFRTARPVSIPGK